jgi:hypothetical protein
MLVLVHVINILSGPLMQESTTVNNTLEKLGNCLANKDLKHPVCIDKCYYDCTGRSSFSYNAHQLHVLPVSFQGL